MNALELQAVSFAVSGRPLLGPLSLMLRAGETLGVAGPNGAGKSTLLRLACGEHRPTRGTALLHGEPLTDWPPRRRARHLAYMPQQSSLQFDLSVRQVVALGRAPHEDRAAQREQTIGRLLADCDLDGLSARSFTTLSGGEKQRVHLARVLAQLLPADPDVDPYVDPDVDPGVDPDVNPDVDPDVDSVGDSAGDSAGDSDGNSSGDSIDNSNGNSRDAAGGDLEGQVLLLDEPTSAMDIPHQEACLAMLRRLRERGCAIALVMHDINRLQRECDRLLLLRDGVPQALGPTRELITAARLSAVYDYPLQVSRLEGSDLPYVHPGAGG